MRNLMMRKIFIPAFLLAPVMAIAMAGCSDSDKAGGATSPLSPPTVLSVVPLAGSTTACSSTLVSATFSKAMNPTTINATTFTVTPGVSGPITADPTNTIFTLTPSSPLVAGTMYTATITSGALSQFGVALAGNFVWTFTPMACATPAVVSVLPAVASTTACPTTLISATFNTTMNPATINATTFTVTPGVSGTITANSTNTVFTLTPSSPLTVGTQYTATITTGAQSNLGVALPSNFVWTFTPMACPAPFPIGATACSFGILAGSTVTNTSVPGGTNVSGNIGVWPGTAITGFPPGTLTGALHSADAVAMAAQGDLTTAYNNAAGAASPPGNLLPGDIGGQTKPAGVYHTPAASSLGITGNLTLDGNGDPNAVFIFQIGSTLTTAAGSVNLIGGAQAKNVFWQVGSSATLGTGTTMTGNVMALASITLTNGATLNGRALARNGAVTLDTNKVNVPPCP
jgi:hypothetical protein